MTDVKTLVTWGGLILAVGVSWGQQEVQIRENRKDIDANTEVQNAINDIYLKLQAIASDTQKQKELNIQEKAHINEKLDRILRQLP